MSSIPSDQELEAHFSARDPKLVPVIHDVGPFLLKPDRNYFEVLVRAIMSQQISTRAADTIHKRFCALFPNRRPRPEPLLLLREEDMRQAGLSRQKISYLKDLAHHFHTGRVKPRRFAHLGNEEIIKVLTEVKGIGRWTAEMFLVFSLCRLDVLPVDDLGLQNAVKQIYKMRTPPDAKRLRALGKKWHPYEAVATWYAWRFLTLSRGT